jgi:hypothetical protein
LLSSFHVASLIRNEKVFRSGSEIRDKKWSDPDPGKNIPDPKNRAESLLESKMKASYDLNKF